MNTIQAVNTTIYNYLVDDIITNINDIDVRNYFDELTWTLTEDEISDDGVYFHMVQYILMNDTTLFNQVVQSNLNKSTICDVYHKLYCDSIVNDVIKSVHNSHCKIILNSIVHSDITNNILNYI